MSSQDPNALAEPLGTLVRFAMWTAKKEGQSLTLVSGRRSNEQQIALRRAHCGSSDYDIWEKPASKCSPPTAKPIGRGATGSKHLRGEAADMGGAKEWMARLLAPYGVTRPVRGEDWHFEYRGSNPQATLARVVEAMKKRDATEADYRIVFQTNAEVAITRSKGNVFSKGWTIVTGSAGDFVASAPGVTEAQTVAGVLSRLADPEFLKRVARIVVAVVLILIGLGIVFASSASSATPAGRIVQFVN